MFVASFIEISPLHTEIRVNRQRTHNAEWTAADRQPENTVHLDVYCWQRRHKKLIINDDMKEYCPTCRYPWEDELT